MDSVRNSIARTEINQRIPGTAISVLRLDRLDNLGSGNKSFKLKYNIDAARSQGLKRLASFGGAYSNHIHALALMGRDQGFETLGFIRGEPAEQLNPTLSDAVAAGMQLHYVSRSDYRLRNDPVYLQHLAKCFPQCYWIPEGGSNLAGVRGCMDVGNYILPETELIILPCGTAATLAGIAAACPDKTVIGVSVLKGAEDLGQRVIGYLKQLLQAGLITSMPTNWSIIHDYHCGGYARVSPELIEFMQRSQRTTGIGIEPVYSAKMFFALAELLKSGEIACGTAVTAIHTGGMQGLRGMLSSLYPQASSVPAYRIASGSLL